MRANRFTKNNIQNNVLQRTRNGPVQRNISLPITFHVALEMYEKLGLNSPAVGVQLMRTACERLRGAGAELKGRHMLKLLYILY